jgi:hypothetical protein
VLRRLSSSLLLVSLVACASPSRARGVDRGLYRLLTAPNVDTEQQARARLERAVDEAAGVGESIEPGLRAALAFHLARAGDSERATALLREERAAYPSATRFLDALCTALGLPAEGGQ